MWEGDRKQFDAAFLLLFAGSPVVLAGICGFSLGYSILDPDDIRTSVQAMMRGLMIALLSYLLFCMTSALILGMSSDDPFGFLISWAVICVYGFFYVGWLITIVGVVGGWLLYLYRLKNFDTK
jgi:hypothetical protein